MHTNGYHPSNCVYHTMNHYDNMTHPPCCGVLSILPTGDDKLTDGRTVYCNVISNV